jgi:hypothetical protein
VRRVRRVSYYKKSGGKTLGLSQVVYITTLFLEMPLNDQV